MIYSMTGYANRTIQLPLATIQIEIRSVNHRFFALSINLPEEFKYLEANIREKISTRLSRGKIDLRIYLKETENDNLPIKLNPNLLKQYFVLAKQIQDYFPQVIQPTIADIINLPGILIRNTLQPEEVSLKLLIEIEQAVEELLANQKSEGNKLAAIFTDKINQMELQLHQAITLMPKIITNYQEKLKQKLIDAIGEMMLNDQRFQQEFVYFCQKFDVEEELNRLQVHITQFKNLLQQGGVIGKKIDFITQEMHREANTFGAKSTSLEATQIAVELKVLIEQIKEQIQNIM